MLGVILTILKILGIILLVILGLLLLIVAIVLFAPIRYRSKGFVEKTDEGIDAKIYAKVTWLLHIVSVGFQLDGKETILVVKIFGKRLNIGGANKADTSETNKQRIAKLADKIEPTEPVRTENTASSGQRKNGVTEKNVIEKTVTEETVSEEISAKEKKPFKQKIFDILEKIKNFFEMVKRINAIKSAFIEYLKRDESKIALREIKKIIFGAIRHILPQRFRAKVWFGFEDPATTGNVLGVLSIFYGIYGNNIDLNPDFEKEVLKLEYELKGRIRIFTLLRAALRIYSNKWIKEFIAFSKETVNLEGKKD